MFFSFDIHSRTLATSLALIALLVGCGEKKNSEKSTPPTPEQRGLSEGEVQQEKAAKKASFLDENFPLHADVVRPQIRVRQKPDRESPVVGWLRLGSRVRLKDEKTSGANCSSGWYPLHPFGFVCVGQGLKIKKPDETPHVELAAKRDETLPYDYYYVKEPMVAQFHQLPSRDQQRAALAFSKRYLELLGDNEKKAKRMLAGELKNEPKQHPAISKFLGLGFYVASTGSEVRSRRHFARTVSGAYVKKSQLEKRTGSSFHGFELNEELKLPLAILLRNARPLVKTERADGTLRFRKNEDDVVWARHKVLKNWKGREKIGADWMHHFIGSDQNEMPEKTSEAENRYLKDWFVGVAEQIEPPFKVEPDEPWVHVDLSAQTLVVYKGKTPIYVTLVSSGVKEHQTPIGTFTIHKKSITDTMANLGPDAGDDRYRIEDVPWTQYFEGSFALHTAFWHNRFGLVRSHGCVNLSPQDAQYIFANTWPEIPEGWHGVNIREAKVKGSRVHVTE